MKKFTLIFFVLIISVLIGFAPLLPASRIEIKSEVPVDKKDIFFRFFDLYFTYLKKINVSIERKFLKISIEYSPEPIFNAKFKDGLKGITENGYLVTKTIEGNKMIMVNSNISDWNRFSSLFIELMEKNLLDEVKSFELHDDKVAFFDKKGILIIVGDCDISSLVNKYLKTIEYLGDKAENVKIIDMQYKNEGIIIWR